MMTILKRHQAENKLRKLYDTAEARIQIIIDPLIVNYVFMADQLGELQRVIDDTGMVEGYQHGPDQSGMKMSAACNAYNTTLKSFNAVTRHLVEYLPEESQRDELADFVAETRKLAMGNAD